MLIRVSVVAKLPSLQRILNEYPRILNAKSHPALGLIKMSVLSMFRVLG